MTSGSPKRGPDRPGRLFVEFLSSRVGNALFSLGTLVIVTRTASVETAGDFVAATGYALLLFAFLDLGTGPGLVRQAARGKRDRHITIYVWTRALLTAIVVVLGAAGILLLFPAGHREPALLCLGWVAASMYGVLGPIGQVLGTARPFRIVTLVQGAGVFLAVVAVVVVSDEPSASALAVTYSASAVVTSLLAIVWLRPVLTWVPLDEVRRDVPANLRSIALLGFATGAGSIYLRIDQTLVLRYLGGAASAYYGLAARIATQARLVPSTLQFAIGNLLAQRHQRQDGLRPAEIRALTEIAAFGGIALAFMLAATSDLGVWLLAGSAYDAAVIPAAIMAVGMVSTCFNYIVGTSAIMAGKDRLYFGATVSAAVFNIAANVLFLGSWGIDGAAAIATATELVALVVVRSALTEREGGLSFVWLTGSVAVGAIGAELKIAVIDEDLAVNACVSALLFLVGGLCAARAYRSLRALPHGHEDEITESAIAAGVEATAA